jgi:hypothetical protein
MRTGVSPISQTYFLVTHQITTIMKRLLLLLLVLAIISEGLTAQTNPTPWDLKDANFEFFNMEDGEDTLFPQSMHGWLATCPISIGEIPETVTLTGDAIDMHEFDPTVNDTILYKNEHDLGISLFADNAGAVGGVNKPVALGLAINTVDCYGINVNWIAQTILNYLASSESIQLYYRIGTSGSWKIVNGASFSEETPVFVPESFVSKLPQETNNQAIVQLVWHLYSNDNLGPMDRIAIHGIVVNPDSIAGKVKQKYCYASGLGCDGIDSLSPKLYNDFNYISNVSISGASILLDNASGCDIYGDYTSNVVQCEIGESFSLSIDVFDPPSEALVGAWIDWNDDGDFDDTDENLGVLAANRSDFNFTPGANVTTGLKRLRIRNTKAEAPLACGTQGYGEVEDYTINVINPLFPVPDCTTLNTPTDNSANTCNSNLVFTWSAPAAGETPTGYKFYLGTDNPPANVKYGVNTGLETTYTLNDMLTPSTTYYWQAIAYNNNGDAYDCQIFSFTTGVNADPSIDAFLINGTDTDTAKACVNVDLPIIANTSGGTGTVNFVWSRADSLLDDNSIFNPTFNSSVANNYYGLRLTLSDDNGCSARDSVMVFVNDNPTPGTVSADKTSICPGEDVTLTLTGHTGNVQDWEQKIAGGSYTSIGNINDVHTTTISDDTQFKVLVEKDGCVAESNEVLVTLKAPSAAPTVTVSPSNEACVGEVITLTSSEAADNMWDDASNSTTAFIDVTSDGIFSVTYTDPTTGCSATSSPETITFNALPVPKIALDGKLCDGDTMNLITQFSGVTWDLDGTGTANTDDIDVTTSGTYTVTYIDPITTCEGTDNISLTFNQPPADPIINVAGLKCEGNELTLSTQYTLVEWEKDGNTQVSNTFSVFTDGLVTVEYEDQATLCVSSATENITYVANPADPIIDIAGLNCEGNELTLSTQYAMVSWEKGGNTQVSNTFSVFTDGLVTVEYEDQATLCVSSATENITYVANPADPIIDIAGLNCEGNELTLSTQYAMVSWEKDGNTQVSNTFSVFTDGLVTVEYEDQATLCSSTATATIAYNFKPNAPVIEQKGDSLVTNPLQIVDWLDADGNVVNTGDSYSPDRTADQIFTAVAVDGNDCESDESNEVAYDHTISILSYALVRFDVFPNPATDELNIVVHAATSAGMYQLKDMTGRTIKQVILFEGQSVVSITDIDSGVYLLQHESGSAVRVVKQ